jgi:hypothetical protein
MIKNYYIIDTNGEQVFPGNKPFLDKDTAEKEMETITSDCEDIQTPLKVITIWV